jgi:hypothetical protein
MRPKHLIAGLALPLAFGATAVAMAVPPNGASAVTLDANPTIIVYSGATALSGRLSGNDASGAVVRLEQDNTRPYGDSYQPTGVTTTTANNGKYSLTVKPLLNTQYRVVAKASPSVTSAPKLVSVRMLVGLKLSDSTPERGRLVRFSGSVSPAHDGLKALIQKRTSSGRFVTVARKTLADAGNLRSSYSRRLRIYRDGVYRVKVAGDGDHVNGFSRVRTVNVHG